MATITGSMTLFVNANATLALAGVAGTDTFEMNISSGISINSATITGSGSITPTAFPYGNNQTFTYTTTSTSAETVTIYFTGTRGGKGGGNTDGTVTITLSAGGSQPNAFNLLDIGPAVVSTVGTTAAVTITGQSANTACSVSGTGSPQLQVCAGSVCNSFATSGTISSGNNIKVRLTAPATYSSTHTATLTIGSVTDTITITSEAAPSGAGGQGTTGGSSTYGIQVFDPNGTTSVLSPSTRFMVRLTEQTSISIAAGGNVLISCNMAGLTTSNSDVIFEDFGGNSAQVPVTRESNGFRITNNGSGTFNNVVYVVRF